MCAAQLSVFMVGDKTVQCAPTVNRYYVHFMLGLHENWVSVDFSSCRAVWLRILSKSNVHFKYLPYESLSWQWDAFQFSAKHKYYLA